ncbi:MAG: proline dehydrogenase family protein [Candidatus Sulfobium sp.]|jgi:RHH-type proline utilization regulon transcriptional repressor/proline dehydrogenase/delta 1-pyrroline-5-carboxylate dehydrogenase
MSTESRQTIEERIRQVGSELQGHMKEEVPSLFEKKKWIGRIMERVMKDEEFKVRLFRFVDVLPALKSDDLVVRVLKEYFSVSDLDAPLLIKRGIERLSRGGVSSFVAARVARTGVETLARQFIAGRDPESSGKAMKSLRKEGADVSIDLLGEIVVSDREAGDYRERYIELLNYLGERAGRARSGEKSQPPGISLKISSFYSQLDPVDWDGSITNTLRGLRPVLDRAGEAGIPITFDMEHYYYKDLTIELFKKVLQEYPDFPSAGIALQAYLRDTRNDLEGLIEWAERTGTRILVRLVKGAYRDYEVAVNRQKGWPVPTFMEKGETDRNFEELTRLLFENTRYIYPAFATHNIRSISHAIATADMLNVPGDEFEFQMLYGMAEPVRRALLKMGRRVTVYTAVGEFIPGMAYLIRRLLENSSDESFLRKSFFENRPFDELMQSPPAGGKVMEKADGGFTNEPPADFSIASNREKMRLALQTVKTQTGSRFPVAVAGRELFTGKEIKSGNPSDPDEIIGIVSSGGREEADAAVAEARKAFHGWKKVGPAGRADHLFRAAAEMRKQRFELAALEIYETGKTWKDADGDITEAIDYLEYYGREMLRLGRKSLLGDYPGEENEYSYSPRGVGVVISPWNFPLAIPTGMVSASVVAGNCVIFKPSGLSPVTGWKLFEVFKKSGLPEGVLQFLPGPGGEVGEHLVAHPDVDFIAFTGSREVGLRIIRLAGETGQGQRNVKKVVAEMGGKNAVIVDETADLDEAVRGVLESALVYQGQKCSACSRVIVVGDTYDEFTLRLKEAAESIRIGPPEDPATFMGPVIDVAAKRKVEEYIDLGRQKGAPVLIREVKEKGLYVGPALFEGLSPDSRPAQEEIFGPVVVLFRVRDLDEALQIANGTEYALTGGLFSRSPGNIAKVRSDFMVGNLYINRKITGSMVGRQPFGGFGMSGVGSKAGGHDYLLHFMNPRSISENTMRRGFTPELG